MSSNDSFGLFGSIVTDPMLAAARAAVGDAGLSAERVAQLLERHRTTRTAEIERKLREIGATAVVFRPNPRLSEWAVRGVPSPDAWRRRSKPSDLPGSPTQLYGLIDGLRIVLAARAARKAARF